MHCNGTKAKRMRLIGGQKKMPVLCKHMVKMGTQAAWARAKHTGLVGARTSMNPRYSAVHAEPMRRRRHRDRKPRKRAWRRWAAA